ncbi:hypothetical protein Tco_0659989 [Tanacetum coccineum]
MLDKTQYSSWVSRMLLYIKGKESGKVLVDSLINKPFQYGTVTEPITLTTPKIVRARRYDELTSAEKLRSEILLQERESKLYDEFDMFTSMPRETIHSYYLSAYNEGTISETNLLALVASTYNSSTSYTNQTLYHQQLSPFAQEQVLPLASQQLYDITMVQQRSYQALVANHSFVAHCNYLRLKSYGEIVLGRQTQGYTGSGARSNAIATWVNKNGGTNTISQAKEIPTLAAFQTDKLDAFDFDCDEAPSPSVVLMAKLSSYDSEILSKVPTHDNYLDNHMIEQSVQEMMYSEQPVFNNDTYIDITSDSNMISYEQYLKETENTVVQDTSSFAQQEAMIMSVIEEMNNQVAKCNEVDKENKIIHESSTAKLERYKEQIKLFEGRQKFD